ncbi:iron-containing alcohol dehydrogenase family protein [Falsiroseomonas sp.]|uniref:iron-containing alcohol dehydrogenase family protein n=1 Tax=Falsiroseomonas sp. TaxID=2870721 RepID=UPI003F72DFF3
MLPLNGLTPLLAPSARVWQGSGLLARAGEVARAAGWRRVLIVTDPGLARLPLLARLRGSLQAVDLNTDLFASVVADPPVATVEAALARFGTPEAVVSLGGGSSIDTAKALAACFAEDRSPTSLTEMPPKRALPHLAVPTTAGTGAEASNSAILTDAAGRKRAIIAECLPPGFVLLDPDVLTGQPRELLVACGLDALSHGLESLVSKQAGAASRMFSRECIRLVAQALPRVLASPDDAEARSSLQLGAHLGGAALRLARLGYMHAIAHAVAEFRHLPHGLLIARALPAVVAFNTPVARALYDEAAQMAGHAGMPALITDLIGECGVTPGYADLALTADERAAIVARCVGGPFHTWNPRRAEAADFARLLDAT